MAMLPANQALDRAAILMDLHARTAASMADAESRNDHFVHAAREFAAMGMADVAIPILSRLDDSYYCCYGWIKVGLALARRRAPAAITALANAGDRLVSLCDIDPSIRMEFLAELALGHAISGQQRRARREIGVVLEQLVDEPCSQQRLDVASVIIEAAYRLDLDDILSKGVNICISTIDDMFNKSSTDNRAIATFAKALRMIGRQDEARMLGRKCTDRMIEAIGSGPDGHSPLVAARRLIDLAEDFAQSGDTAMACWIAQKAMGLRMHPTVRFQCDFDIGGSYLNPSNIFYWCARNWGHVGAELMALEAMDLADRIVEASKIEGSYVEPRTAVWRRLRKSQIYWALGRREAAERQLNQAEWYFACLWEQSRSHGRDIDSVLYELPEIAAMWSNLSR